MAVQSSGLNEGFDWNKPYEVVADGVCGFAWVEVYGVKGSTKLGKALIACGMHKNYGGGLRLSGNAWSMSQSMGANEEGARAAAKVLGDPDCVGLVRQLFGQRGVDRLKERASA
jgi:hypothetical protein